MSATAILHIRCHSTQYGCCEFTASVGDCEVSCRASWLGEHPASRLLVIAVRAFEQYHDEPYVPENAWSEWKIEDEPGGLIFRFDYDEPERIGLVISQLQSGILPPDESDLRHEPYFEGRITLANLMEEAWRVGAETLRECGLAGMRMAWDSTPWDEESRGTSFPLDEFLFLCRSRELGWKPPFWETPSLAWEVATLQAVLQTSWEPPEKPAAPRMAKEKKRGKRSAHPKLKHGARTSVRRADATPTTRPLLQRPDAD